MGNEASAHLACGVYLDEDGWADAPWEDDYEEWWYAECGFKPTLSPWTKEGNQKPGVTDDQISAYFAEKELFWEEHPFPVEVIRLGHYDADTTCILAVLGTEQRVSAWEPQELGKRKIDDANWGLYTSFMEKYFPEAEEPKWILGAYYG